MGFAPPHYPGGTQRYACDNRSEFAGNVLSPAAIASMKGAHDGYEKGWSDCTEARQAEPGPSVLLILIVNVLLALIVLGTEWFVLF
jgi:hypothetical protein